MNCFVSYNLIYNMRKFQFCCKPDKKEDIVKNKDFIEEDNNNNTKVKSENEQSK